MQAAKTVAAPIPSVEGQKWQQYDIGAYIGDSGATCGIQSSEAEVEIPLWAGSVVLFCTLSAPSLPLPLSLFQVRFCILLISFLSYLVPFQ